MRIPLFPLGTVLFPGGLLPLQIFEVRYLDMIKRCQQDGTSFGVVGLTQGSEVRQRAPDSAPTPAGFAPEVFYPAGTLASIEQFEQPVAGLMRIQVSGEQRFRILQSEQLPHGLWMADIECLPADTTVEVPPELLALAAALDRTHRRLRQELGGVLPALPPYDMDAAPWNDAGWVANRWAELLPTPLGFKQALLMQESPLLRLELIGDLIEQKGIPF